MTNQYGELLKSKTKLDVIIPVVEKDLEILPYVIDAVIKHVQHPLGEIIIVAPESYRIKELCKEKMCKFIDESTLLSIRKQDIDYRTNKWDRSGWLFQQLLKLSGNALSSSEHFLVIDADTVLIRPHIFHDQDKTIFYCRSWSHKQYFKSYKNLLGVKTTSPLSFVSHYMMFEKKKLIELKKAIEIKHHTLWYNAILQSIDKTKKLSFSEFETYGNFFYAHYPEQVLLEKSLNKSLNRKNIGLFHLNSEKYEKKYRSVSFHERKGYLLS